MAVTSDDKAKISAKDVMALRQKSGLGMMECKAALAEAGGDMAAAEQKLREKGLAKMDGRTDRTSAEGKVAIALNGDRSKGAIIEVNTETDFTANNEQFVKMAETIASEALKQEPGEVEKTDAMQTAIDAVRLTTKENAQFGRGIVLGTPGGKIGSYVHHTGKIGVLIEADGDAPAELLKDLCMHVSATSPMAVREDEVSESVLEDERKVARAQALEQGKPENIAEKMVEGKIRKYLDEVVLLRQPFVKDEKMQVQDLLPAGVQIRRFVRYQVGG